MLKYDLIEPSSLPWAANVVIVGKKDGSQRMCLDYRPLNNVTRKDCYPLPRISECLDAMGGMKYFSSFDLRSGYHQIILSDAAKAKTSFVTKFGTYQFKVMSFGLCNAPATFQRLMDTTLRGLNYIYLLVYLDDIIVFAETIEQHLERLEMLFDRLRQAGLKLKPSKCQLLRIKLAFLGHVISADGIATDEQKIAAVKSWVRPTNVSEVRSFLGLASYYRRFVKDFSLIAAPLHALTKKNKMFNWIPECEESFNELKDRLTSTPILQPPLDEGRYWLDTDASNTGIGAVLSQEQDGELKVIAYASRLLHGPELNYCATRKELLALINYVTYFRTYLLGRPFTIRTDHAALKWLKRMPDPVGQQARWLEMLEEYDYTIEHRPGRCHGNADALSRIPCRQCGRNHDDSDDSDENDRDERTENKQQYVMTSAKMHTPPSTLAWGDTLLHTPEELATLQKEDPEVGQIYKLIEQYAEEIPWEAVQSTDSLTRMYWGQRQQLCLHQEVLYRHWTTPDGRAEKLLLVAPVAVRRQLCAQAHEGLTGGHLAYRKTYTQLERRAYWIGRSTFLKKYLEMCERCRTYKRGPPPRQGELRPLQAGEPMDIVAIDLTGPHPTSRHGHKYILTMIDHFTKWVEAVPIRDKEATTVADAIYTHWVCRLGAPQALLSDLGTEFQNAVLTDLCKLIGVQRLRTTAYKASTNGAIERFHRTMNSMLAKTVEDNQRDWDVQLPAVLAAYRATTHESTGYSPNFLLFGRENRAPLDVVLGVPEGTPVEDIDTWVDVKIDRQREAYDLVRDHTGRAAERYKCYYNQRVKKIIFKPGDFVHVYVPRRKIRRSPKWQRYYTGPFRVMKKLTDLTYVVQGTPRSQ